LNWTFELLTFLHVAKHLIAIVFTIHLFIFECFDVYIANWFSNCVCLFALSAIRGSRPYTEAEAWANAYDTAISRSFGLRYRDM